MTKWINRFDAWQRRGGTPRWMLYMWVYTSSRMVPALIIWLSILWIVNEYVPHPTDLMAFAGAFAILFWIADRINEFASKWWDLDD